jgi:hypothetical protein
MISLYTKLKTWLKTKLLQAKYKKLDNQVKKLLKEKNTKLAIEKKNLLVKVHKELKKLK